MMKVTSRNALLACILAFFSLNAFAGAYICSSYGDAGCAEHIKDIVSDKFTKKYPSSKYEIVIVYQYDAYSDGGGVGFAVAGVSPKVTEKAKYGNLSLMPINRFLATQRDTGKQVDPYEVTKFKINLLRRATRLLMEACDRQPSCDVITLK